MTNAACAASTRCGIQSTCWSEVDQDTLDVIDNWQGEDDISDECREA